MATPTDNDFGDEAEAGFDSALAAPLSRLNSFSQYPLRVGPIEVNRDAARLSLRRENEGGLGWETYLLFAMSMFAVTLIGFLAVIQNDAPVRIGGAIDRIPVVAAGQNHFTFLWIIGIAMMLIGVPVYVGRAYRSALTFTFDKQAGVLRENNLRIVGLSRIEYVNIRETKDSDGRYLYLLRVSHTDGHEVLLYNGYEEREVLHLAGEIASFLDCQTKYSATRAA